MYLRSERKPVSSVFLNRSQITEHFVYVLVYLEIVSWTESEGKKKFLCLQIFRDIGFDRKFCIRRFSHYTTGSRGRSVQWISRCIDLYKITPSDSILGYSHLAATGYLTFADSRSPLQDTPTPAVIISTTNVASPLSLQLVHSVSYVDSQRNAKHSAFHSSLSDFKFVDHPFFECPRLSSISHNRQDILIKDRLYLIHVHAVCPVKIAKYNRDFDYVLQNAKVYIFQDTIL